MSLKINSEVVLSKAPSIIPLNETNKEKLSQTLDQFIKLNDELILIQQTIQHSLDEISKKEKEVKSQQGVAQVKAPEIFNSTNEDEITKAVYHSMHNDVKYAGRCIRKLDVSDLGTIKKYAEKVITKINGISQFIDRENFTEIVGVKTITYLDVLATIRYLVLTEQIPFLEYGGRNGTLNVCFKLEDLKYPHDYTTKQVLLDESKSFYEQEM
jgi:hypothetical protein